MIVAAVPSASSESPYVSTFVPLAVGGNGATCDPEVVYVAESFIFPVLDFNIETTPGSGFIFDVLTETDAYFHFVEDEDPGYARYLVWGRLGHLC